MGTFILKVFLLWEESGFFNVHIIIAVNSIVGMKQAYSEFCRYVDSAVQPALQCFCSLY